MITINETEYQVKADERPPAIRPLELATVPAALELFAALHAHNAGLDERFALADDWRRSMTDHLVHMLTCPECLAQLAWVELLALYIAPAQRGSGLGANPAAIASHRPERPLTTRLPPAGAHTGRSHA